MAAKPRVCTWCDDVATRYAEFPMTTGDGRDRLTWKKTVFCSTDCLSEWASNLHAENPEWHKSLLPVSERSSPERSEAPKGGDR